jgi:hypothetical protein
MKTEPAADTGRLMVERFRPLPVGDGAAPAMHDPVGQWTHGAAAVAWLQSAGTGRVHW